MGKGGGKRGKHEKERVGPVAANQDNLIYQVENNKEEGTQLCKNCTSKESLSPLSRLIRDFRNKFIIEGMLDPSCETKFSGANADREILIFPVQLTTCRIGNLTRLIHILAVYICDHTSPLGRINASGIE